MISNNGSSGVVVFDGSTARVSASTVTGNGTGLFAFGTGTLESFGDNLVRGNTTNTSGTITAVAKT